jgi:hypothetical protein
MFKKVLSYILIIFGLAELIASTSRTAMQYISEKRDNDKWWGVYQCANGDLVSLSYLDFVSEFKLPKNQLPILRPAYNGPKNTALYLHGDSYSYHLHDTDFAGLAAFYPIDRNHGLNYHLDSTKRNILIIEVSERYVRAYFSGLQIFNELCDSVIRKKSIAGWSWTNPPARYASFLNSFHISDLFNKYINQNLQCNLFNYNFIIPMFEYKAALNYYVFNRASGDVVISNDRQFLFLKETVSKTDITSSYAPLAGADITLLVDNFNKIYDHYKENGFREVYLSIIPNSATIIQPDGYNNLIPLIQQDPRLRMKVIDAYTNFRRSAKLLYLPGDTHWNNTGRQLWLDLVNEKLMN